MTSLTSDQIEKFRLATAAHNASGYEEDATIDDSLCSEDDVTATTETLADFIKSRGTPANIEKYSFATLYIWENQQARKGARRGDLYVVDFGDRRAAYFSGEA